MEAARASGTAVVAAIMRAAHPAFDSPPWIFNDTLAARLAGFDDAASLGQAIAALRERLGGTASPALIDAWSRSTRLCPAVRARYAEDRLGAAIERGVSQYVILGAGLDSYAYRTADGTLPIRVFELDHAATQEQKRARLAELGIDIPSDLEFVPIDFETQSILDVLNRCRFDPDEPAFFSWLGVTFFLTDDAIENTLRQVAAAATGSEIVFDYVLPNDRLDAEHQGIADYITSIAIAGGETGGHRFDPAALEARATAAGFSQIGHFSPDDADAAYFADRTDGLRASRLFQFMRMGV